MKKRVSRLALLRVWKSHSSCQYLSLKIYHLQKYNFVCFGHQGCARFPEFLEHFSERQILLSLCSVVFYALNIEIAYSNFTFCGA